MLLLADADEPPPPLDKGDKGEGDQGKKTKKRAITAQSTERKRRGRSQRRQRRQRSKEDQEDKGGRHKKANTKAQTLLSSRPPHAHDPPPPPCASASHGTCVSFLLLWSCRRTSRRPCRSALAPALTALTLAVTQILLGHLSLHTLLLCLCTSASFCHMQDS